MATLPLETQEYITTVLDTPEEWMEQEVMCEANPCTSKRQSPAEWLGKQTCPGCYTPATAAICDPCVRRIQSTLYSHRWHCDCGYVGWIIDYNPKFWPL